MAVRCPGFSLTLALLLAGAGVAQEIEIQVELTGPLGTQINRKGDRLFARVIAPESLRGDTLEGHVTDVRAGGKAHGRSVLNFEFENLFHAGRPVAVSAKIRNLQNSKGGINVDEGGRGIRTDNDARKAGGPAAVSMEVSAEGAEVRLDAGSRIAMFAQSRGGESLAAFAGPAVQQEAPAAPGPAPVREVEAPAAPRPVEAEAPAPQVQTPAAKPMEQEAPPVSATAPPQTASADAAAPQPDFSALKDDFIPGDRVILFDDFTDMAPDEPPPHWKVRGATLTLMASGALRQLAAGDKVTMTPAMGAFPANFTLETEARHQVPARWGWYFFTKDSSEHVLEIWLEEYGEKMRVYVRSPEEQLFDSEVAVDFNAPMKQAIWRQDGRLRVYLNGQKVTDANQLKFPQFSRADLVLEPRAPEGKVTLSMVRIGESTPDFSRTIAASGRWVTHGILFDTDSDRLRPESGAVLKMIARGLQTNSGLQLKIEGHTDATGAANHNLDLSKRRAEAVKAVLVSQFGIAAARLATEGCGSSKPIDSNDTPQGRGQNRRVEFVKQ